MTLSSKSMIIMLMSLLQPTRQEQRTKQDVVVILHSLPVTSASRLNHHDNKTDHMIGYIVDDLVSYKIDLLLKAY